MKTKKQTIQRRTASFEGMASNLRETIDEVSRQVAAEQIANAFVLMRANWPVVVYCVYRRFHEGSKSRARSSTAYITALSVSGLDPTVVAEMQAADIAAVMGTATPENVEALIAASVTALDATEPGKRKRRKPSAKGREKRRPALFRWASAAAGLFAFGH
jgi:hypothetical protein